MEFVIATRNMGKFEEIKRILEPLGIHALSQGEADVSVSPEETGESFEENARIKALAVSSVTGLPSVADDSGLCVYALNGAPGIYSARFAGPKATDKDRIEKLLYLMRDVPQEKRGARFSCAICCIFPDGREVTACGVCEGYIAARARGESGFGYDPVFVEKNTGKTFSQLSPELKDKLSHRGHALRKFAQELENVLKPDARDEDRQTDKV